MRVDEIKRLVELVEQSQIDELEIRRWWGTVRISKVRRTDGRVVREEIEAGVVTSSSTAAGSAETQASAGQAPPAEPPPEAPEEELVPIVSPMVGTFYQASSPTSSPYVEVGGRVTAGQVVCMIEAMKLMNEVESEVTGTVVKILAKNEQPVEYNQPLYLVRPES